MSKCRHPQKEHLRFLKAYAAAFADSIEYSEQHLAFLAVRRDNFIRSLAK